MNFCLYRNGYASGALNRHGAATKPVPDLPWREALSACKGRVDRLASLDQALHGCDRFFKHLLFGWIECNLDNFLDAIGADHHRHADIKIPDAIFPVELRRA